MDVKLLAAPLSARFDRALIYAAQLHVSQFRKSSPVPYIAHLLAVASTVLDFGGTEDEAIAALLHDAIEDQGGAATRERIRELFGDAVVVVIDGCTESDISPKPPWRERKEAYITHIREANASVRLVALADKLHNARTTLRDYQREGDAVWDKFNARRIDQCRWYESLLSAFRETNTQPLLCDEFGEVVERLFPRG